MHAFLHTFMQWKCNVFICLYSSSCSSSMGHKIEQTNDKGRCITTTASLQRGDVILEEPPYAAVLYDGQQKKCNYTFEAAGAGKCVRWLF